MRVRVAAALVILWMAGVTMPELAWTQTPTQGRPGNTGPSRTAPKPRGDVMAKPGDDKNAPVTVDADGDISGYGTVTGAVTNVGTITAVGGTLELTGSVTGVGTIAVDPDAALQLALGGSAGTAVGRAVSCLKL